MAIPAIFKIVDKPEDDDTALIIPVYWLHANFSSRMQDELINECIRYGLEVLYDTLNQEYIIQRPK
jgi:hypothetical protein